MPSHLIKIRLSFWCFLLNFLSFYVTMGDYHHMPLALIIMFRDGQAIDASIISLEEDLSGLCLSLKIL